MWLRSTAPNESALKTLPRQVRWLTHNVGSIQRAPDAGQRYKAITELVGDRAPGPIHAAINRPDLRFAGPCPTIRAHDRDGQDVRCNHMLYAHDGEQLVTCPRCQTSIDVEQNRRRAATLADLLPAETILEIFTTLGEPISKPSTAGSPAAASPKFLTAAAGTNAAPDPVIHASTPSLGQAYANTSEASPSNFRPGCSQGRADGKQQQPKDTNTENMHPTSKPSVPNASSSPSSAPPH
jgi:hypothetical protein